MIRNVPGSSYCLSRRVLMAPNVIPLILTSMSTVTRHLGGGLPISSLTWDIGCIANMAMADCGRSYIVQSGRRKRFA